jgi:hypothetical protein
VPPQHPHDNGVDIWNWATVGIIAAAIAIVAWLRSVYHWLRVDWQRRRALRKLLKAVEARNYDLRGAVNGAGRVMVRDGVTWAGWRIPPPNLVDFFRALMENDRALEQLHARVRGVRSEAAVERLRADIEQAVNILRSGVGLHLAGLWSVYRESFHDPNNEWFYVRLDDEPRKYGTGAGRDAPVPTLYEEGAVEKARQLSRDLDLVVRSAWYQARKEKRAEKFEAGWPMVCYELDR